MAYDFPTAPTNGQLSNGYAWNGYAWAKQAGGGLDQATADARYVNVPGDTMSGRLTITNGEMMLHGFAGDVQQSLIYLNQSGSKYLQNAGTLTHFVGTNVGVNITTASTSPTTGALTVGGGIGVGGDIFMPANKILSFNGQPSFYGSGTLTVAQAAGGMAITATTASTSPTTGALTVAGGLGITKELWLGGATNGGIHLYDGSTVHGFFLNSANTSLAIGTASGHDMQFWAGNVLRGGIRATTGDFNIVSTTPSTSPTMGALTVAGGVGVSGAVNAAGDVSITKASPDIALIKSGATAATITAYQDSNALANKRAALVLNNTNQSVFSLQTFNDTGTFIANALAVERLTGNTSIASTTASTSPTTGALTVAGGVGVAGTLTVGASGVSVDTAVNAHLRLSRSAVVQSAVLDDGASIVIASNAAFSTGMKITHGANAWTAMSDARLPYKKTAREMSVLDRLDGFQLYENEVDGRLELFVKAQEFNAVLPHLVQQGSGDDDYTPTGLGDPKAWGVSYDRAGIAALQAVKELQAEMKALRARVAELEGK